LRKPVLGQNRDIILKMLLPGEICLILRAVSAGIFSAAPKRKTRTSSLRSF
jgi:hypothetical protein